MSNVINFMTAKKKCSDMQVAEYYTEMELSEFRELYNILIDYQGASVLFKDIDLGFYLILILEDVLKNNYVNPEQLKDESVKNIINFYSERDDLEEIRNLLRENKI